ncbi:hypothetical protein DFH07DRAFT_777200 [Mycena maculata]|uniref:Uncharacterized protein n=1 Tax=Mycena maculata TaxID=230809 RepID=A0AAD7IK48_9AGAR|nr:hypothetical protein DFH07DRAFT_777200 [Mycena maculata]
MFSPSYISPPYTGREEGRNRDKYGVSFEGDCGYDPIDGVSDDLISDRPHRELIGAPLLLSRRPSCYRELEPAAAIRNRNAPHISILPPPTPINSCQSAQYDKFIPHPDIADFSNQISTPISPRFRNRIHLRATHPPNHLDVQARPPYPYSAALTNRNTCLPDIQHNASDTTSSRQEGVAVGGHPTCGQPILQITLPFSRLIQLTIAIQLYLERFRLYCRRVRNRGDGRLTGFECGGGSRISFGVSSRYSSSSLQIQILPHAHTPPPCPWCTRQIHAASALKSDGLMTLSLR